MSPLCSLSYSATAVYLLLISFISLPSSNISISATLSFSCITFACVLVCVCVFVCERLFTRSIPSVSQGKRTMEFCSVAKHSGSVRLSPHLHNKNEVRAFPRRSTGLPPISTNTHPHTNTHMHWRSCSPHGMEIAGSQ